jgi:predicted negative regulator of RcsB-dependent stress response
VEIYESERDQVEALRKWWKENGRSIVLGVVLGLGGVLGWRAWQGHQQQQAARASILYQQLLDLAGGGSRQQAVLQGERLVEEYPKSLYAGLTSLLLARLAAEDGDLDGATRQLDRLMKGPSQDVLKPVARLQEARILLARGKHDEALAALAIDVPTPFRGPFAELRGDILAARGDSGKARQAYEEALQALARDAPNRALVRLKLDDLGSEAATGGAGS